MASFLSDLLSLSPPPPGPPGHLGTSQDALGTHSLLKLSKSWWRPRPWQEAGHCYIQLLVLGARKQRNFLISNN